MKERTCYKCGVTKDEILFTKNNNLKSGYNNICKQCDAIRAKDYYESRKESVSKRHHEYYRKNKENIYAKSRIYRKEREKLDPSFKIASRTRARIYKAVKRGYKNSRTTELIGCSFEELKTYIESKFVEGMSWENYGKWEIDHIIPCASFDLTSTEQQKKCFNYSNLHPLWSIDNKMKGKTELYDQTEGYRVNDER